MDCRFFFKIAIKKHVQNKTGKTHKIWFWISFNGKKKKGEKSFLFFFYKS